MTDSSYFSKTRCIRYDRQSYADNELSHLDVQLRDPKNCVTWLNTYGLQYAEQARAIIEYNQLDDFLKKLLTDQEDDDKVLELEDVLLVSVHVLKTEESTLDAEQILFITDSHFVWSIQEKEGDHFNWIRERLQANKGLVRKKRADYLLYLLLESIIDNYQATFNKVVKDMDFSPSDIRPTPSYTAKIEYQKQQLFRFKRATSSLRDVLLKIEKVSLHGFEKRYFAEIKEQTNNLVADIDFSLQEVDSKLNLIFSIQGHRLNEVMKTLTIFSVIFIPLTFMAGIYGMNFARMPELAHPNGYYYALTVMLFIGLCTVAYIRSKKWF